LPHSLHQALSCLKEKKIGQILFEQAMYCQTQSYELKKGDTISHNSGFTANWLFETRSKRWDLSAEYHFSLASSHVAVHL
jgi:hypothetical protein